MPEFLFQKNKILLKFCLKQIQSVKKWGWAQYCEIFNLPITTSAIHKYIWLNIIFWTKTGIFRFIVPNSMDSFSTMNPFVCHAGTDNQKFHHVILMALIQLITLETFSRSLVNPDQIWTVINIFWLIYHQSIGANPIRKWY